MTEDIQDGLYMIGAEEAPLALMNWVKANGIYYECKVKCGWSNKTCKDECLVDYNTNINAGKVILAEEIIQPAIQAVAIEALPQQADGISFLVVSIAMLAIALTLSGVVYLKSRKTSVFSYIQSKPTEKLITDNEEFPVLA
jgi:hypothetical protein